MNWFDQILGEIRGNAPTWSYTALLIGWRILTVLTLISMCDLGYRLFRRDHGLKP